jgi:dihydrodipicolinate synthase/N-acetylneuraminate lyase
MKNKGETTMKTGIYVPLITPFKENGEVDYEVLAKATKFVLAKGADGIYACGGTSEFCLLTTEERKRCLEVIIANADGKEVIAHVGSQSTAESVELAKHAASVGANMLSAVAPYYFGYTFPQIKEYFRKIAHATELELMIYNAAQARDYSLAEMKELL